MNRLWAPWRMKYIKETIDKRNNSCFLCEAYKNRDQSESLVVASFNHTFVVLNKFPYNNGHLMIVPIMHTGAIGNLDKETKLELMNVIELSTNVLREKMNAEGFNIGINLGRIAGAGVPEHLHIHVVPRWNGDTNYMPVISDTKVISQGLQEAYEIIKEGFEEVKGGV